MRPMREITALITVLAPLSLLSFGGGASILGPLHDAFVQHYQWLTSREYVDYFAISRASPGPGAMLVTLIGWKLAGWAGALVATIAIFLPSSLLCYRVAGIWNRHRGTPLHRALERGLVPIGTGLTIAGAVITQHTSETGAAGWIVALATTALLTWRNVHPLIVLTCGGMLFLGLRGMAG
jgi:chromate transporter